MSIELGKIGYLAGDKITEECVHHFFDELELPKRVNTFDCAICGAERVSEVEDPGYFIDRRLTCAEAKAVCQVPPQPKARARPYFYVPGSFVFAPWQDSDDRQNKLWPAMVEDPPDYVERYIIHGKTPERAKAYHISYIIAHEPAKWLGGFIRASQIIPLTTENLGFDYRNATPAFKAARNLAFSMVGKTLRERLITFSFVAKTVREQPGLAPLPPCEPEPFWKSIIDKHLEQVGWFHYSLYDDPPKKPKTTRKRRSVSDALPGTSRSSPPRTRSKTRTSTGGAGAAEPEDAGTTSDSD